MSKQAMYGLVALIVLVIIGGVVYMQSQNPTQEASQTDGTSSQSNESSIENNAESTLPTDSSSESSPTDQGRFSDESDVMAPDVAVHEIFFSGTAYSPATLTIKNGDIVVFKNNSEKDFWPASAMHPDHLLYPEFDAKEGVAPGKTYQFKFTKTGAWGFHDHLTPSAFGKITVQ